MPKKKPSKAPPRVRPTHDEITSLVGDLDDAVIAAIFQTGASYAEIEQAARWAGTDLEEAKPNSHGLSPLAEQVYDILVGDPNFVGEEERRGSLS
jgi:hypothetical protein